ncbi:MAG: dTDP-4-dehydrorhamnose reductase [Thermoplasmata archaeon]|nr:dTDP-4-dehydrorhamnose reductase [Thermoplasmata archaeon]
MRLLVTGSNGMLGLEVMRAGERAGHEMIGLSHSGLDICDEPGTRELLGRLEPDGVLNCAAWTDVDGAESDPDGARAVNRDGAGNLAACAAALGARMVHVSTDYVFNGRAPRGPDGAPRAYLESDPTGPATVYGLTKLEGEELVMRASPRHAVARTAWLFGLGGRNFAETMLTLAEDRDSVRVVADQIGCPTWSGHLAPALLGLLEREVGGIVHLAGTGAVSWHGFAAEIFRQAELDCEAQEASSAEMARPAPRPPWSALESERDDVLPLPPWQDGLAGYLAARAGMMRA